MDTANNTEHVITDFSSLEDESLTLLGLDVDQALKNSIAIGQTIKKRTVLYESIFAFIILVLVIGLSTYLTIQARGNDAKTKSINSAIKVKTKTEPKTAAPIATPTIQETPNTQAVIEPFVYPSNQVGNISICNAPSTQNPGSNGVDIGTSVNAENYVPKLSGNNFNIPSTPGLVNVVDSNAPGGQYVVFNKGSFQNDSYRKQSSSGLTYCDSAKRVDVTISGSGYIVQTETY